jgi:hypothetical protein
VPAVGAKNPCSVPVKADLKAFSHNLTSLVLMKTEGTKISAKQFLKRRMDSSLR